MGKCNTLDNKWKSELPNASIKDDGELTINEEGSDGTFDGKHEKSSKPLSGKCRGHKEDNSIWFVVSANRHLYFGVFVTNKRIRGVRFNLDELHAFKDKTLSGDEEWVATKT